MYHLRQSRSFPLPLLCAGLLLMLAPALFNTASAQERKSTSRDAASVSITPAELERFLDLAFARTGEYTASFRDLTAEEKQSVELYDARGRQIKRREIVSDFVVYQSRFDRGVTAEYRNVREVDKVPVSGREERVLRLFKRLATTTNVSQELELISGEASRYDLNYSIQGYTLKQGLPLQKEVRAAFSFAVAGKEELDGHETLVVSYKQSAPNPLLKVDLKLPSLPKAGQPFYRGRLWLDARTAQIRREERELVIEAPRIKEPLVLIRQEFNYADSQFDILTPKLITLTTLGSVKLDGDRVTSPTIGGRLVFEYGAFSRFNVTIPGANVR